MMSIDDISKDSIVRLLAIAERSLPTWKEESAAAVIRNNFCIIVTKWVDPSWIGPFFEQRKLEENMR